MQVPFALRRKVPSALRFKAGHFDFGRDRGSARFPAYDERCGAADLRYVTPSMTIRTDRNVSILGLRLTRYAGPAFSAICCRSAASVALGKEGNRGRSGGLLFHHQVASANASATDRIVYDSKLGTRLGIRTVVRTGGMLKCLNGAPEFCERIAGMQTCGTESGTESVVQSTILCKLRTFERPWICFC
jgi:hypothetical protein